MSPDHSSVGILVDRVDHVVCSRCGAELDVTDIEPFVRIECPQCRNAEVVPARLGSFKLLDLLGTGGMGGIYYAKDETLGRLVAVKVMLKSLGQDQQFVETFRREAQAAAKLNHPHVAQIYSFGTEKDQPYIVMELVTGKSLAKLIEGGKPLDQAMVLKIGLEIAEGLMAADEIGLIHGDIKPENILIDSKTGTKLVDFGIATFANQSAVEGVWGTPYYIAPEKVRRQRSDARSDIYSLGATLYHALAGRAPFEGETPAEVIKARLEAPPVPLHEMRPDVTPELEGIVMRMLQPEPAQRYPTYASLTNDMRKTLKAMAPDSRAMDAPQIKSRRMLIKKKRGGESVMLPPEGSPPAAGAAPATGTRMAASGRGAAPATAAPPGRKRALKALLWIALGALALVGLIAGLAAWRHGKARDEQRKRDAYAVRQSLGSAQTTLAAIGACATNIAVRIQGGAGLVSTASNAAYYVLGDQLGSLEPPSAPAPSTQAVAAAAAPTGGVASATNATNVVAAAAAPVPPPEPVVEDPVKVLAKQVVADAHKLEAERAEAQGMVDRAAETRDAVAAAATPQAAQEGVQALTKALDAVRAVDERVVKTLKDSKDRAERADAIKRRTEQEREAQRKAQEEARKRAEEDARLAREAAERKALADSERQQALAARAEVLPLIRQNQYQEAAESLRAKQADCRTDEGREAFKVLIDRYSRLHKLRLFFVEKLNEKPFRWGWGVGAGSTDILGADDQAIRIAGDRTVPWANVGTAQMMKFIRQYLDPQALSLRELADGNLAAAVFCYEVGGQDVDSQLAQKARDAARPFAQKAADLLPTLAPEVQRLVPAE